MNDFNPKTVKSVTIAASASVSGIVDLAQLQNFAIQMPASWTVANLTFQSCDIDTGTFLDLYDDAGAEVVIVAAANRMIAIDFLAESIRPLRFLKIRSGTTSIPVAQAAARTLKLIGNK